MKKDNIIYFLIMLILIWLPIYQDSMLYNYLGSYGHAPIAVVSIILYLFCLITKRIKKNKYIRMLWQLIFLTVIISLCSIVIYYIFINHSLIIYGENLIIKMFKGQLYFVSITCYLSLFVSIGSKFNTKFLLSNFKNVYITLFIIMIIEYFTIPSAFSFLHAIRPDNYYRIRLLTSESSWTTTIILVYYCLSMVYSLNKKSKINGLIYSIMLLIFIYFTSSKSLMLCIIMWLFLYFVCDNKKITVNKLMIYFLIFVIGIFFFDMYVSKIQSLFLYDIENSTSVSTRLYSIYCGFKLIFKNPLGYGTSVYLPVLIDQFAVSISDFQKFSWFNFSEIYGLILSGNDSSVAVKSGVVQYTLYWGVIGTAMFFKFFKNLLKELKMIGNTSDINFYKSCVYTILIFITFVSSFDYKYEIWSFIGFIILLISREGMKKENDKNISNVFTTIS